MSRNKNIFDIVIITEGRYIHPTNKNWYIDQVLLEDKLVQVALEKKGLRVCRKDWADPEFNWKNTEYAIFRTTWDYFEKLDEFYCWIEKTKHKTKFINSSEIINWNIDKQYLKDLAKNNINIAPTVFINKEKNISLSQLFIQTEWNDAVIKPAISGAAIDTYRINVSNYTNYEHIFQKLITEKDMLFQQFMNNILFNGEVSLIMIGQKYTHAVKKTAKKGDFRVQDDHGGIVEKHTATKEEILFAERCLKACPYKPIYARVDIVYDNKNKLALSELELIEPELWFRNNPKAATLLAETIFNSINYR